MIQMSSALPQGAPLCQPGHTPQLIETRGMPPGCAAHGPVPYLFHIECARCQIATVPHPSRAIAEGRWSDPDSPHRIPLSQIRQARAEWAASQRAAA